MCFGGMAEEDKELIRYWNALFDWWEEVSSAENGVSAYFNMEELREICSCCD